MVFFTKTEGESDELAFLIVEEDETIMEAPFALALGGHTLLMDFNSLTDAESVDLSVECATITAFGFDLVNVAS